MKTLKTLLWLLLIILFINCPKIKQEKVLAKVNGEPIMASEFVKSLPKSFASEKDETDYRRSLIDQLINKKLIVQAAIKNGVDKEIEGLFAEDQKSILIQAPVSYTDL
ncbi:MAG: SurA N-terminal domain-containing protein, partial [candidate division WOR-3 bacterium]|nr:SurA N-terminal domain-containing protein [candidate division WOR-3 bacterium]